MGIVALVVFVVTFAWTAFFGPVQPSMTKQQLPMRYYLQGEEQTAQTIDIRTLM